MATRTRIHHRLSIFLLGSVLSVGITANLACEVDEGDPQRAAAESPSVPGAAAAELHQRDVGYVFVEVGAWDDTNLEWPAADSRPAESRWGSDGYKFLDVGVWDDTDISWPPDPATGR